MAEPSIRRISGEVFSAARFFRHAAHGGQLDAAVSASNQSYSQSAEGVVSFSIAFEPRGVHIAGADIGSLEWIDGFYADSIAQERFIETLKAGAIPEPLSGRLTRTLAARTQYTSPERLAYTPLTALAACGLIDSVIDSAINSSCCQCNQCGTLLTRYTSPISLLDSVRKHWSGKTITLNASTYSLNLNEWAQLHGLTPTISSTGAHTVLIDRFLCQESSIAAISTLLHLAWRVPDIYFTVSDASGESLSYSPNGWCNKCQIGAGPVYRATLSALLTRGLDNARDRSAESQLVFNGKDTISDLLMRPVGMLSANQGSLLSQAQALLGAISLDGLPLGSRTDILDAQELACLSLIRSFLAAEHREDTIVVDLPRGLMSDARGRAVMELAQKIASFRSVIVIGETFSPLNSRIQHVPAIGSRGLKELSPPIELSSDAGSCTRLTGIYAGELVQLCRPDTEAPSFFNQLTNKLRAGLATMKSPAQLVAIPLFLPLSGRARVVGEELGVLEPLAQLYAASLDARTLGLTFKDFTLFSSRSPRYLCRECSGLGVILTHYDQLPRPLAHPCPVCCGARCSAPINSALFRGVAFSAILNQPIKDSSQILAALAKARQALELTEALDLQHLALGMPTALLSCSEQRRLAVARAIRLAKASKPVVVAIELMGAGLSDVHQQAVENVRNRALGQGVVAWFETAMACSKDL